MDFFDSSEWLDEPLIIQVHATVAILGFFVGGYAMVARKGTARHKRVGRIFALLALSTAATSFFIHEIRLWGLWSPIHLLSIYTIWMIWRGVSLIRQGDMNGHLSHMRFIYLAGFVVAGSFTLIPDRLTYKILLQRGLERLTGSEAMAERVVLLLPIVAVLFSVYVLSKGRTIRLAR